MRTHTQYQTDEMQALVGKVLTEVSATCDSSGSALARLAFADGTVAYFNHYQDCCETVELDFDCLAELQAVLGQTLRAAEVTVVDTGMGDTTWYKLRFAAGDVTLRFAGDSEYYSTDVSVEILTA
jgi:hypothetical protein